PCRSPWRTPSGSGCGPGGTGSRCWRNAPAGSPRRRRRPPRGNGSRSRGRSTTSSSRGSPAQRSQPRIGRPARANGGALGSVKAAGGVVGGDAGDQVVAVDAHGHVAVGQERQPAEHLLLVDPGRAAQAVAEPLGERVVKGHVPDRTTRAGRAGYA